MRSWNFEQMSFPFTDGVAVSKMTAENVRNLLGEMIVFAQRTASLDDVTQVEVWNQIPTDVRDWARDLALASLPKLIEETHAVAADRVKRITALLETLQALESTDAPPIEEQRNNVLQFPIQDNGSDVDPRDA